MDTAFHQLPDGKRHMTSSFIRQTADGRYEYGTVARAPGCRKDTMTVVGVRDTYEAAQIADYQMRKAQTLFLAA